MDVLEKLYIVVQLDTPDSLETDYTIIGATTDLNKVKMIFDESNVDGYYEVIECESNGKYFVPIYLCQITDKGLVRDLQLAPGEW